MIFTIKNVLLALFSFIAVAKAYGQATNSYGHIVVEITKAKKTITTKVEIKSAFPGGDTSWLRSLEKNLDRSIGVGKRVKKGKYIVSIVFIIDKNGDLADIRCENDPGFGIGQEVVRLLKKSTKWFLAEQGGREVKPYRTSRITDNQ